MPKTLYWKLTLTFLLAALITAGLMAVFIRITSVDRLFRLIQDQQRSSLVDALVSYYSQTGTWNGIEAYWPQLQWQAAGSQASIEVRRIPADPRGDWEMRSLFGLADEHGRVLIGVDRNQARGEQLTRRELKKGTAVMVNGEQVGTVLTASQVAGLRPEETTFLRRTNQALLFAMLGALLVALLLGVTLARTLTRPLAALTQAAQNIAQGKLEQQVPVDSSDEIGQLATAFNRMSQEVSRVNQQRRQMTADIAHDLRTPLTVIGGYVEAMRDGVLQPTPERFTLIYGEIERLQDMVSDLRMLSQADAGELPLHPQPVSPRALLNRAAELFQQAASRQGVTLSVETREPLPEILVDEARMMQVMDNLLSNALRYTPPGGTVFLSAQAVDGKVEIAVRDTGSGIEPEELPYIFDRFHRADKSRHSETGESGLGLAIVRALVEAQGGSISAASTPGSGTTITMRFPA